MLTKDFVTAGNAIFTIELPPEAAATQKPHYTFRVRHKEASERYGEVWFVSLLTGPENTSDYTYVGMLNAEVGSVRATAKSGLSSDAFPLRLLNRVLAQLWAGTPENFLNHGYRLHHEGKCGRCGRTLTVPESVENGIGPECAKMMAA